MRWASDLTFVVPEVDAALLIKILLDQVEIAIAIQVAELAFMGANAGGDELSLEAAASVAVEHALAAGGASAGGVHLGGVDIQVAVAVEVADLEAMAMV